MENKDNIQQASLVKNKWYPPYIVGGLIYAGGQAFAQSLGLGGEIVLLIACIGILFIYYPLKSKIKIKNEVVGVVITFFILLLVTGFLVGFLGSLINNFLKYSNNSVASQQSSAEYSDKNLACQTVCNYSPTKNLWSYNTFSLYVGTNKVPEKYRTLLRQYDEVKYFETQEQCLGYCLSILNQ